MKWRLSPRSAPIYTYGWDVRIGSTFYNYKIFYDAKITWKRGVIHIPQQCARFIRLCFILSSTTNRNGTTVDLHVASLVSFQGTHFSSPPRELGQTKTTTDFQMRIEHTIEIGVPWITDFEYQVRILDLVWIRALNFEFYPEKSQLNLNLKNRRKRWSSGFLGGWFRIVE